MEEKARKLASIDVPMIMARFDKLGVMERLNESQRETIKLLTLEHCQEGREELWWCPLIDFAKTLRYQKGDVPIYVFDDRASSALVAKRHIFALDYMLRTSGIQLEDLLSTEGEEFVGRESLMDGRYPLPFKRRSQAGEILVQVEEAKIDVLGLVADLNGLLAKFKAKERLLLLPCFEGTWCVLVCLIATAERAHQSKWAQLVERQPIT